MRSEVFLLAIAVHALSNAQQIVELTCSSEFSELALAQEGMEVLVRCPASCPTAPANDVSGCAPAFSGGPICGGGALQLFGASYLRLRRSFTVARLRADGELSGCTAGGVLSEADASPSQSFLITGMDRGETN